MSGHSKFANIKHKKEKNDAAKGKIFTKLGRELAVAVKEGGGPDPANNSRLRDVIAKAKANNMPNDTIDRNIKKAAGEGSGDNYEHITYEGYGPNGTAIIVKTLTDNKNRTASNVRNAFTKGSGNVGTPGCVSFMFDEKGQIIVAKEDCDMDADELMMMALDFGAEDFSESSFFFSRINGCFSSSILSAEINLPSEKTNPNRPPFIYPIPVKRTPAVSVTAEIVRMIFLLFFMSSSSFFDKSAEQ